MFIVFSVYLKVRKMKAKGDFAGKICVVVGTITDDLRLYEVPALKVGLYAMACPFYSVCVMDFNQLVLIQIVLYQNSWRYLCHS